MDMSEIYIKMSDCKEVQDQDCGGLYKMGTPFGDVLFYTNDEKGCSDDVWLPRQDEIQKMIYGEGASRITYPLLVDWDEFMRNPYAVHPDQDAVYAGRKVQVLHFFKTFEQLWLAFYMHEKHQKTWDGEKWISVDNA